MRNTAMMILAFIYLSTGANADCKADLQAVVERHLKAGPCHVEITVSTGGNTLMYVDPATNLPAWMAIDGESRGKKVTTIQHTMFDSGITIKAPD